MAVGTPAFGKPDYALSRQARSQDCFTAAQNDALPEAGTAGLFLLTYAGTLTANVRDASLVNREAELSALSSWVKT